MTIPNEDPIAHDVQEVTKNKEQINEKMAETKAAALKEIQGTKSLGECFNEMMKKLRPEFRDLRCDASRVVLNAVQVMLKPDTLSNVYLTDEQMDTLLKLISGSIIIICKDNCRNSIEESSISNLVFTVATYLNSMVPSKQ